MVWSSLVVTVIIVGLVTALFALLRKGVHDRQLAAEREDALLQRELESQGVDRAIRHFRHDMGNQLWGIWPIYDTLRTGLDSGNSRASRQALQELEDFVEQFMSFVKEFRVDSGGERPAQVDVTELLRQLCKPCESNGTAVHLGQELNGWYVVVPPVAVTLLVGNLVKNACEAADELCVLREAEALVLENPISAADRELLADGRAYEAGASSKGEGRGTGLDSAREAAERCGAELSHELFSKQEQDWVRFRLEFG